MNNLLMLHGWGFPAAVFSPLIDRLPAGCHCQAPDRPGYRHEINQAADSQLPVLQAPTVLLGWSQGGQLALQLALQQPAMVSAVVLLASTPCFISQGEWSAGMERSIFDAFRKQVEDDPSSAMSQFVRLNNGSRIDRDTRSLLSGLRGSVSPAALLDGLHDLETTDLRSEMNSIQAPVLLLHATDDLVVPVTAARWLAQALPNAELVEYPVGGHAFFIQHADAVAWRIGALL